VRVLVTGGCGFVGANLISLMNRTSDFSIRVLDNESIGRREHIADLDAEVLIGDVRDREALNKALRGIEAVVHLAADTGVVASVADPRMNFDVNVVGTLELLLAMRQHGVKRLVNASTGGAIVGSVKPPVHEDMAPHPISPYGASKLAAEGYCDAFAASYGLDIVSLRFSNVYGPRSFYKGSVVATFMKSILAGEPITVYGDGTQTRDYVFADDVCGGILAALARPVSGVYQLGSGTETSINDLVDMIRAVVRPRPVDVCFAARRKGEVPHTYCDISRARRALDYRPVTSLPDGLARTWAWFLGLANSPKTVGRARQ